MPNRDSSLRSSSSAAHNDESMDIQEVSYKRRHSSGSIKNSPSPQRPKMTNFAPPIQPPQTQAAPATPAPDISLRPDSPQLQAAAPQQSKIPPVILSSADDWSRVSTLFNENRINFTSARTKRSTLRIQPSTPDDYRSMTRLLTAKAVDFHTFALPDERPLRVVIRGLPTATTIADITADLTAQGFPEASVSQFRKLDKKPMPLFSVNLPRTDDAMRIFRVTSILRIVVSVESPLPRTAPPQCHRCQAFGHTQRYCNRPPVCFKCAEPHSGLLCPKSRETPAVCCNCRGNHPASDLRCPRNPKNRPPPLVQPAPAFDRPSNRFAPLSQLATDDERQPPFPNQQFATAPRRPRAPAPPQRPQAAARFAPPLIRPDPQVQSYAQMVSNSAKPRQRSPAPAPQPSSPSSTSRLPPVPTPPPADRSKPAAPPKDSRPNPAPSSRGTFSLDNVVSLMEVAIALWTAFSTATSEQDVVEKLLLIAPTIFNIVREVYG